MNELDKLLARSQDPARLVERRRFTLSRERAIEKLRRFALRDPSQYVLELVQAAVLHGADYCLVSVVPGQTVVAWVGAPAIPAGELERLFDNLFADHATAGRRHLSQLAIGANGVLQQRVKQLRIESGDGSPAGSARLELDHRGEGVLGQPQATFAGTWVSVDFRRSLWQRLRPPRFFEEEALVEERCQHCPIPIVLNGRAPFGWKARRALSAPGLLHPESFEADGCRGVIGVEPEGARGRGVVLVVGGVEITQAELPELGGLPAAHRDPSGGPGIGGVIACDDLRKTADQSDIVQDDRYVRLLHAARPAMVRSVQRVLRRRVAFPPLPPRKGGRLITAGRAPDVSPVPDPIPQLAPRSAVPVEQVRAMVTAGTPVLRMHPGQVHALEALARPSVLPLPVLLLEEPEARALALQLDDGAELPVLAAPPDVELARRLVEGRAPRLQSTADAVPWDQPAFAPGEPDGHWHLELYDAAGGPRLSVDGPVMVILEDASGRERVAQGGPAGLPPLVARRRWPAGLDPDCSARVLDRLCWRAAAASVALLGSAASGASSGTGAEGELDPVRADLVAALLAWAAVPCGMGDQPAAGRAVQAGGLRLRLPPLWEDAASALLECPLGREASGDLVTAAGLLARVGGGEVFRVDDAGDARRLATLEACWGAGMVWHAPRERCLVAVARGPAGWAEVEPGGAGPQVEVWTTRTVPGRTAWTPGLPWVVWGAQGGVEPGQDGALDALLMALLEKIAAAPPDWEARARAAATHAAAALAHHLGELDSSPVLLASVPGRDWQSVPLPERRDWSPWRPCLGGMLAVPPALVALRGSWSRWGRAVTPLRATGVVGVWGAVSGLGQALIWEDTGPLVMPLAHTEVDAVVCATPAGRERLPAALRRASQSLVGMPMAPARALQQTTPEARRARRLVLRLLRRTPTGAGVAEGRPLPHPDHPLSRPASRGDVEAAWALVLALGADEDALELGVLHESLMDVLSTSRRPLAGPPPTGRPDAAVDGAAAEHAPPEGAARDGGRPPD